MVVYTIITASKQIVKKPVNGRIYVYERTPYYDKTIKNTKYHYKYIGTEINGKTKRIRSTLPRRSLIYGPFIPLLKITESIGLMEMLHRYLTEDECNRVIALAISKIVRPLPQNSISTWYDGTYLSVVIPANISSQRNSELMEKIGSSDLYRRFSLDLIRKLNPESSLLYDITSIPSYSVAPIFEYGHSKDHDELEQINFSMLMEKRRGIPLYYELYPGSIPDIVTLKRTIEYLSPRIREMEIILDRGFFSVDNLRLVSKMKYTMAASIVRKEVKALFSSATRTVDRADNVIMYDGNPIFCQKVSFQIEELNLTGYFYHDPKREAEERSDFHRRLKEKREMIEKMQVRKGLRRSIENTAGSYIRYISYSVDNGHTTTKAKDNAISAEENRMGRFLLVYRGEYSALECLSLYRQRDAIEKAFRVLKTDLDLFPLRDHKEPTIRGTMFVFFLSLIIRTALLRGMQSSRLNEKYSIERMLLELEKLHMMEDQNGNMRELERTRKQKDILEVLERISWW